MDSVAPATFPRFPDLPTELRLIIWELCLPRRIIRSAYSSPRSPYDTHIHLAPPARPPLIARVNQEARSVALQHGRVGEVALAMYTEHESYRVKAWIDPSTDAYLDCTHYYDLIQFRPALTRCGWDLPSWVTADEFEENGRGAEKVPLVSISKIDLCLSRDDIINCGLFGLFGESLTIVVSENDKKTLEKVRDLVKKGGLHGDPLQSTRSEARIRAMDEAAFCKLDFEDRESAIFYYTVAWLALNGYEFPLSPESNPIDDLCDILLPVALDHWDTEGLPMFDDEDQVVKGLLEKAPPYIFGVEVDCYPMDWYGPANSEYGD